MSLPVFSVVVPTYNRPQQLARCLEALTQLDYPNDRYQIVIIDDGSRTPLAATVEPFRSEAEVVLVSQANAGPAAARNAGAHRAEGEFIAFTDDDCMPAPDWLKKMADRLQSDPDAMVGGRTVNDLPENLYSTASQALIDYLYSYYSTATQGVFFASNNIAMARSHFLEIGGFDVSFPLAAAEDRELCDRWQQSGYAMQYAPEITIRHAHFLSLKSFWRQHFGYGRGAFCYHQARAKRTEQPIQVEPFRFYRDLLTYPLQRPVAHPPLLLSSLFMLSQIATTAGFFWERWTGQKLEKAAS
ncbi:MAG: glycosyltransferase [Phormidesmis sp.]